MRKFIVICSVLFAFAALCAYAYFYQGFFIDFNPDEEVTTRVEQRGKQIYLDQGQGLEEFEIKGVDMGAGIPGHFSTEYSIDKETYLRWFRQIKDMGANTVRVYILQNTAFYEAFYEYNKNNPDPLYLIHGVWINDYTQNSHMDAFDTAYIDTFLQDVRTMIDAVHGKRAVELGHVAGTGSYTKDISPWVIGYILGVEWESPTVAYTNLEHPDRSVFEGEYMSTTPDASPFEAMLAQVANEAFRYESARYKTQRLVALSNWATTDPFDYPEAIASFYEKYAKVDVEHITCSDKVLSGTFASYHIYPYYPDILRNLPEYYTGTDPQDNVNTYFTYLKLINDYHSLPVVISEFGVPSSRGMAQMDANTNRNQGAMSEDAQGRAIVQSYQNIKEAGCAGSIIFTWQDEWFKRTWNTMANVDLLKTPYWSDYQTNEQHFGLLSFDPGKERSVSYVDGNDEEWSQADVVGQVDGNELSMKYDEKFLYFKVQGPAAVAAKSGTRALYMPIDTTQKTGATRCEEPQAEFERAADFLMVIHGEDESRVLVQERYEVMRAMQLRATTGEDAYISVPDADTPTFKHIDLVLQTLTDYEKLEAAIRESLVGRGNMQGSDGFFYQTYETGKLTYGDANPDHDDFDSMADYCYGPDFVEIKIPWQLLNFSNPSEMQIHDDYYEHYGVENMKINSMYVGVGQQGQKGAIALFEKPLAGWGSKVTYHERLKESYYIVQKLWTGEVTDPQELWDVEDASQDALNAREAQSVEENAAAAAAADGAAAAAADGAAAAAASDAAEDAGTVAAANAAAADAAQAGDAA